MLALCSGLPGQLRESITDHQLQLVSGICSRLAHALRPIDPYAIILLLQQVWASSRGSPLVALGFPRGATVAPVAILLGSHCSIDELSTLPGPVTRRID